METKWNRPLHHSFSTALFHWCHSPHRMPWFSWYNEFCILLVIRSSIKSLSFCSCIKEILNIMWQRLYSHSHLVLSFDNYSLCEGLWKENCNYGYIENRENYNELWTCNGCHFCKFCAWNKKFEGTIRGLENVEM